MCTGNLYSDHSQKDVFPNHVLCLRDDNDNKKETTSIPIYTSKIKQETNFHNHCLILNVNNISPSKIVQSELCLREHQKPTCNT